MRVVRGMSIVALLALGLPASGRAQPMMFDHVHLNVPDRAKAIDWYVAYLHATRGGRDERVYYGGSRGVMVAFLEMRDLGPSAGTVTDHFALSVASLGETIEKLERSGARILEPVSRRPHQLPRAVIEDPWGTKVELLEDPAVEGFHHMHLRVANVDAASRWFATRFGGHPGKWQGHDGVRFGPTWVLLDSVPAGSVVPLSPITGEWSAKGSDSGHAIDHIGWRIENDSKKKADELKAKGVKIILSEMPDGPYARGIRAVEGPGGVRIEIMVRRWVD